MNNLLLNQDDLLHLIKQHEMSIEMIDVRMSAEEILQMENKIQTITRLIHEYVNEVNLWNIDIQKRYETMTKRSTMIQDGCYDLLFMFASQLTAILSANMIDSAFLKEFGEQLGKILKCKKDYEEKQKFILLCLEMKKALSHSKNLGSTFEGQLLEMKKQLCNHFSHPQNWSKLSCLLSSKFGESAQLYNMVLNTLTSQAKIYLEGAYFAKGFYFHKDKNLGLGLPPVLVCKGKYGDYIVNSSKVKNYFKALLENERVDLFWAGTNWQFCIKCLNTVEYLKERYNPLPKRSIYHIQENAWYGHTVYARKTFIFSIP